MSRILAIDYGKKRVGVAVSDTRRVLATGLPTLQGRGHMALADEVERLVGMHGASEVLLGLPLNMDGTRGPRAGEVERFADVLRARLSIPVTLWDERLSTVRARGVLKELGTRGPAAKNQVDRIAAVLILQGYLDAGTPGSRAVES